MHTMILISNINFHFRTFMVVEDYYHQAFNQKRNYEILQMFVYTRESHFLLVFEYLMLGVNFSDPNKTSAVFS